MNHEEAIGRDRALASHIQLAGVWSALHVTYRATYGGNRSIGIINTLFFISEFRI